MDPATGTCSKAARPFSGPLAPFDEDVSASTIISIITLYQARIIFRLSTRSCAVLLIHNNHFYFSPVLGNELALTPFTDLTPLQRPFNPQAVRSIHTDSDNAKEALPSQRSR